MKLYEISATISRIVDDIFIAEENGDERGIELLKEAIDDWHDSLNDKIIAVAAIRESALVEAAAIKDIIKRQNARVKALEARAEWLERYAISGMRQAGIDDVNTPEMRVRISVGSGAVEISDVLKLPARFFHTVTSVELSKAELRAELMDLKKAGKVPAIDGAHLVFNEKLKIG